MLSLIGFLTRIPVKAFSLESAAKTSYLFPVIGLFIGAISGIFNYLLFKYLSSFLSPLLIALLTLIILYGITGLNHLDGLADFSDGIYVSGNKKRKIDALKDVKVGIAGTVSVVFVILSQLFLFSIINGNLYKFMIAEVSAKTAMLIPIFIGKDRGEGLGHVFIKNQNKKMFPIPLLFSLIISYLLLKYVGVFAFIGAVISSLIIVRMAHKNFNFVNGDVIGSVNEISRVIALFVMAVL